jgi:pyridoxine 4-dehydrogenase
MVLQNGVFPYHREMATKLSIQLGDRTVHRLGFGAMRVCADYAWGPPKDRPGAIALLRRTQGLGINFLDTADCYGPEVSEILIAEALHPYPAGLLIATKGGYEQNTPNGWRPNGRPDHLRRALEGSLQRLKLDTIDLYQLHVPDSRVPFADSVGTLAQMQREGKIRHIGLSSVSVHQLDEARRIATIVSVQNHYNFEDRAHDDVLAACERHGIAFIPWFPLGAGHSLGVAKLKRAASRHGVTVAQLALAWLLARSAMMLPIPGTSKIAHLEENARAASLELTATDLAELK